MPDDPLQTLRDAIARNQPAVLSLPVDGALHHWKTRLLADSGEGFWVQVEGPCARVAGTLIDGQVACALSFKTVDRRVSFAAPLCGVDGAFVLAGDTRVGAVLMRFPTSVTSVQRRSNYRVPAPATMGVAAAVWRMGPTARPGDRLPASAQIPAELIDLSLGGAAIRLIGTGDDPPKVCGGDRLRIVLTYDSPTAGAKEVVLIGRKVHPPDPLTGRKVRVGIRFDDDPAAQRDLARLVAELQRAELRRLRLRVRPPVLPPTQPAPESADGTQGPEVGGRDGA